MNQPQYHSGAINATDCISNGWNMISPNYWLFFGMAVVAMLILMVLGCIPLVNMVANPILSGPIFLGIYYALLKQMRGEPVEFGMLFQGFNRFVPAMVITLVASAPIIIMQIINLFFNFASLGMAMMGNRGGAAERQMAATTGIMMIIVYAVFLICMLVALVVQISLVFAIPLLADNDDMGAVDAMKLSASAAWSNIGGLILLFILEFLILLVGVVALCIGWFFVLPIIYAANAFAFRQVFPDTKQNFQNIPPPPASYGNNYGFGQ